MTWVISRYLAIRFAQRFGLILGGLTALLMILQFLADSDQVIAGSDAVLQPILLYSLLQSPAIVSDLIPVTALLAGMLTFAELSRHQELTAIVAAGVSKLQLALAILPVALLIGIAQFLIEDRAQPLATAELRAWGVGDYNPSNDKDHDLWLASGDDIVRIHRVDLDHATLEGVSIFERNPAGDLVAKIDAARATYETNGWRLIDAVRTTIGAGPGVPLAELQWANGPPLERLRLTAAHPDELSSFDLLAILGTPGLGSLPAHRYRLSLHERLAGPITTLALLMFAVACARPPRGRASQWLLIALGIVGGFLFWTFDGLVLALGDLGLIPPALAAWAPVPVIGAIAWSVALQSGGRSRPPPPTPNTPAPLSLR